MLLNEGSSYATIKKIKQRSTDRMSHLTGDKIDGTKESFNKKETEFSLSYSSKGQEVSSLSGHIDYDTLHLEKFTIAGGKAGVHEYGETVVNRFIKHIADEHTDIGEILAYIPKENFDIVTMLLDMNFEVRETRFDSFILRYSLPNPNINREDNLVSRVYQWL